jgi:hypothetical protein
VNLAGAERRAHPVGQAHEQPSVLVDPFGASTPLATGPRRSQGIV